MITTDSGMRYIDFRNSDGAQTRAGQIVTIHYKAALTVMDVEDGPWLDNSWRREAPITFQLGAGQVLLGIDEGVEGMKIAGERRLIIPPHLAFRDRGVPGLVPPNTTLIFDVYLIKINQQ